MTPQDKGQPQADTGQICNAHLDCSIGNPADSADWLDTLAPHYDQPLTVADRKEIVTNVTGFFDLLMEWKTQQVSQASKQEVLSDGQAEKEQEKAASVETGGSSNEIRCLDYTRRTRQRKARKIGTARQV